MKSATFGWSLVHLSSNPLGKGKKTCIVTPRYVCFGYKPRELYLKKHSVSQVSQQSSLANINAMNANPITPSFCDNVRTGQSHWRWRRRGVFLGWLSGKTWQWKILSSIAVSIAMFDYQRVLIILSSKKIGESRRPLNSNWDWTSRNMSGSKQPKPKKCLDFIDSSGVSCSMSPKYQKQGFRKKYHEA